MSGRSARVKSAPRKIRIVVDLERITVRQVLESEKGLAPTIELMANMAVDEDGTPVEVELAREYLLDRSLAEVNRLASTFLAEAQRQALEETTDAP